MSDKSETQPRDGRRSGSSSARSTRANSVASEDNSTADQRSGTAGSSTSSKKSSSVVSSATSGSSILGGESSGGGSRDRLRYSYEFLKKLQKSKLSRKPPDCMTKLRQENILRETWRSDKDDKKDGGDREVQLDLGMTRRSFVAGCQIANIQPSEGVPKATSKLLGLQAGGKDSAQGSGPGSGQSNNNSGANNGGSKDSNGSGPAASGRRIGSGRLDRTFKDQRSDRDRDYGYGTNDRDRDQGRSGGRRGAFDFRKDSRGDGKGRRFDMGPREDEPEWFTEGPTSQTDTIELGGFEDPRAGAPTGSSVGNQSANQGQSSGSGRERRQPNGNRGRLTPSPDPERVKKSWSEKELLRNLASGGTAGEAKRDSPSSNHDDDDHSKNLPENFSNREGQGAPINFEHFFMNSGEEQHGQQQGEAPQSPAMAGSRFMSKVFSKALMSPLAHRGEPSNASEQSHEPSELRPVMEMLQSAPPQDAPPQGVVPTSGGPPAFLRELIPMSHPPQDNGDMNSPPSHMHMMNNHDQSNGVGGMMSMGPVPGNAHHPAIEALLGGQPHHGPPLHPGQHLHPHPHGMPPMHGPPMEHMNNGGVNKPPCDNGPPVTSGKELIEMLLMGASAPGAPSPPPPPPQHAKTVEQLEAEFKMQSSRPMMQPQPQGPLNHGPHGGPNMAMEHLSGGMPHPPPMDRPLNGIMSLGDMGPHGPIPMAPMGHHFQHGPAHMGVHHPQQPNPNHTASQDIMRMLTEGANRGDANQAGRGIEPTHSKPVFKQDMKNVPTQVLLREKDLVIQREPNSGPRPILKSNKNSTPPALQQPMTAPQPNDTGAEFLQKLLQQHQQQQPPHQQPQPQPPAARHGGPYFGGTTNNNQRVGANPKMIRGGNPPVSRYQTQPPLVLEELFASAGQSGQHDGRLNLGPNAPRPLTGMHGQRYGEMGHYGPPPMQTQPLLKPQGSNNGVNPDDALAKWFGNLAFANGSASMPPSMPRNVLRVEDLERHHAITHQAKMPAAI